ncbi:MAG: hypothetical protein Q4A05_07410 [Ruminococcus sp.]|nr:hypothetical protein [Ruminococcus sp.]
MLGNIHDFIGAALPFAAAAVAVAIVFTYSNEGKRHKKEKKIEK